MVKVDETGAKILIILIEKFAFFDFDMYWERLKMAFYVLLCSA